jgi:hypothetical protein
MGLWRFVIRTLDIPSISSELLYMGRDIVTLRCPEMAEKKYRFGRSHIKHA